MELGLAGKTAFVAAASRGIGRAVATALAREGCTVILTSSDAKRAEEAALANTAETRGAIHPDVCDVRSPTSVAQAAQRALARHGGVDILIANGPGPAPRPALDTSDADLQGALQANFLSGVQLVRAFAPRMKERKFGRILFLASTTAKEPDEGMCLSNVARAATLAYSKTLSREVAKDGITVNTILTGSVLTQRTVDLLSRDASGSGQSLDEALRHAAASVPVGRIASPEEFAQVIAFLASPRAGFINGVAFPLDGGWMRGV